MAPLYSLQIEKEKNKFPKYQGGVLFFLTCVCMHACVCCEFDRGKRAAVEKVAADLSSDKKSQRRLVGVMF